MADEGARRKRGLSIFRLAARAVYEPAMAEEHHIRIKPALQRIAN